MRPDCAVSENVLAAGTSDLLTRGLGSQSRFVQSGVTRADLKNPRKNEIGQVGQVRNVSHRPAFSCINGGRWGEAQRKILCGTL